MAQAGPALLGSHTALIRRFSQYFCNESVGEEKRGGGHGAQTSLCSVRTP